MHTCTHTANLWGRWLLWRISLEVHEREEESEREGGRLKGVQLYSMCVHIHKHTHLKNEAILPANLLGRRVCLGGGRGEGGEGRGERNQTLLTLDPS